MLLHQLFSFNSFGFCGKELKNFCDMTDMLALLSDSAAVVYGTVMDYSALISSDAAPLMTTSISLDSPPEVEDLKSEY